MDSEPVEDMGRRGQTTTSMEGWQRFFRIVIYFSFLGSRWDDPRPASEANAASNSAHFPLPPPAVRATIPDDGFIAPSLPPEVVMARPLFALLLAWSVAGAGPAQEPDPDKLEGLFKALKDNDRDTRRQ